MAVRNLITNFLNPGDSLKWRTFQGTAIVLAGDIYYNVMRLVGNLIMTRLLYPEAFGLMLIVSLVHLCVGMLSDAGIRSGFILKSRGREREYLNTAWSMQIIRGALLAMIVLICAWPVSAIYEKPILFGLIAITSFNALIQSFSSPNELIYDRNVKKLPIVLLDLSLQTSMLLFTIVVLLIYPTVWVLAISLVVNETLRASLSYFVFKGEAPKFELKPEIFSDLFHYGKWIFLSTALTFLAAQGSKLITSFWVSVDILGVFSVAVALATFAEVLSNSLNHKLLLPVYAELDQVRNSEFAKQGKKIKLALFSIYAPVILILSLFGVFIVDFLYDSRYYEAGWMLQVMALGTLFSLNIDTLLTLVLSKAESFNYMVLLACKALILFSTMTLGGYFYDLIGLIYGIAIAPALFYPIVAIFMRRYGIYTMKMDYLLIGCILLIVLPSWFHFGWPGLQSQ